MSLVVTLRIPTFVPTSQFEEHLVSPSSPTADMNSTRNADEVTLPSFDISNVENVVVENNVVLRSAVRNLINEMSKSSGKHYMKNYRTAKEKTEDIEILIQSLSSPVKRTVSKTPSNCVLSAVVNTDSSSIHEAAVNNSLIDYLKYLDINKQYPILHQMMHKVFGNKMTDEDFLNG